MDEEGVESQTDGKLEDDVDALFQLPLAEFINARNSLAARLKRDGRANDANLVKGLSKPSISAWAVNQLHWKHREALEELLATSQRFRQAQASHTEGRIAEVRGLLDARRESLSYLSDLATELLRNAGHNPAPDTIHRILTTLEAVSGYATPSDGPTPGRLTQDVDPPGFASLASLIPAAGTSEPTRELRRAAPSDESRSPAAETTQRSSPSGDIQKVRQAEEARRARIAAAKAILKEANRSLTEARSRAQRLEAAQKKADAEARDADADERHAEKQLRKAEEHFTEASAASRDAAQRAQRIAAEAEEAAQALADAERTMEGASKELEAIQGSPAT